MFVDRVFEIENDGEKEPAGDACEILRPRGPLGIKEAQVPFTKAAAVGLHAMVLNFGTWFETERLQ